MELTESSPACSAGGVDRSGLALVLGIPAILGLVIAGFYAAFGAVSSGYLDGVSALTTGFALVVVLGSMALGAAAIWLAIQSLRSGGRRGLSLFALIVGVAGVAGGLVLLGLGAALLI